MSPLRESEPHFNSSLRFGVVAVVTRGDQFLVIRRSQLVRAPGMFCFPGGGIEAGETEEQAVVREFAEELGAVASPVRRLWRSVTSTNVDLAWWLVSLAENQPLVPNLLEVDSVHWLTSTEALARTDLLVSNRAFYAAWSSGEFTIDGLPVA